MSSERRSSSKAIRPLSKRELDQRMEDLVAEVVAQIISGAPEDPSDAPLRPRWISSAELVRRMRRFLIYN